GRVDGLVVMSPALGAHLAVRDLPASFPVVLLNSAATGAAFDAITIANARGAADMVQHLVGLGHRRLAMILGPETNSDAAGRLRGCWRRWATTTGIASGGSGSPSRWSFGNPAAGARFAHRGLSPLRRVNHETSGHRAASGPSAAIRRRPRGVGGTRPRRADDDRHHSRI